MKELDAGKTRIIVAIVAAVVLVVAFRFGNMPLMEKVDTVDAENSELQVELDNLRAYASDEDGIKNSIAESDAGIDAIRKRYPSEVTSEKSICFINDMENETDASASVITFNESENIYVSTFTVEEGQNVMCDVSTLGVTYSASYEGLKKMMDYINSYEEYSNVRDFTAAYNADTGLLSGTMTINRFQMTGYGSNYKPPVINGVYLSNSNIFGTVR